MNERVALRVVAAGVGVGTVIAGLGFALADGADAPEREPEVRRVVEVVDPSTTLEPSTTVVEVTVPETMPPVVVTTAAPAAPASPPPIEQRVDNLEERVEVIEEQVTTTAQQEWPTTTADPCYYNPILCEEG